MCGPGAIAKAIPRVNTLIFFLKDLTEADDIVANLQNSLSQASVSIQKCKFEAATCSSKSNTFNLCTNVAINVSRLTILQRLYRIRTKLCYLC